MSFFLGNGLNPYSAKHTREVIFLRETQDQNINIKVAWVVQNFKM